MLIWNWYFFYFFFFSFDQIFLFPSHFNYDPSGHVITAFLLFQSWKSPKDHLMPKYRVPQHFNCNHNFKIITLNSQSEIVCECSIKTNTRRQTNLFFLSWQIRCCNYCYIVFACKKSLKIPKEQSESVYRRRTDNKMAKWKRTKGQTTIYKHIYLTI